MSPTHSTGLLRDELNFLSSKWGEWNPQQLMSQTLCNLDKLHGTTEWEDVLFGSILKFPSTLLKERGFQPPSPAMVFWCHAVIDNNLLPTQNKSKLDSPMPVLVPFDSDASPNDMQPSAKRQDQVFFLIETLFMSTMPKDARGVPVSLPKFACLALGGYKTSRRGQGREFEGGHDYHHPLPSIAQLTE